MPAVRTHESPPKRRVPRQERSRRRVEGLLDAAARLVVERGVEALTTRDIAEAAGAPVASLYQYFADKDDILLALVERDMAEMDERVGAEVGDRVFQLAYEHDRGGNRTVIEEGVTMVTAYLQRYEAADA